MPYSIELQDWFQNLNFLEDNSHNITSSVILNEVLHKTISSGYVAKCESNYEYSTAGKHGSP